MKKVLKIIILMSVVFIVLFWILSIAITTSPPSGPYLHCDEIEKPYGKVYDFGNLSQEHQRLVKRAIIEEDRVILNATQANNFSSKYVGYKKKTYNCGVVET